jgi:hypothetical protein
VNKARPVAGSDGSNCVTVTSLPRLLLRGPVLSVRASSLDPIRAVPGRLWAVGAISLTALLAVWQLETTPPLWWDEGWTIAVARNWVERGFYGRLLNGQPTDSSLTANLTVTAPIALSFKLLGVGVWQARIVGVVFMVGALALWYHLMREMFNRTIAVLALLSLVLVFPHPAVHPSLLSRQALGEFPMLFYLLAGYACFLAALRGAHWWAVGAALWWGVALNSKEQALPFFGASIGLPLVYAVYLKSWRPTILLAAGGLGALLTMRLIAILQPWLVPNYVHPTEDLTSFYAELFRAAAFVTDLPTRLSTLRVTLIYGLPTLVGVGAVFLQTLAQRDRLRLDTVILRLMLLALTASWSAWYVALSVGWIRYFFPPLFLGAVFVVATITDRIGPAHEWREVLSAPRQLGVPHTRRSAMARLGAVAMLAWVVLLGLRALSLFLATGGDRSAIQAAHYLNTATPPNAVIESNDTELMAFLDRPYHYPPRSVYVDLLRSLNQPDAISQNYDPTAADPDYLVIGPFMRRTRWDRIYEPSVASGAFRLLRTEGTYSIYERVR